MKYFLSIFALSFVLNADILLPETFTTNFEQTITNEKGKVIKYEGKVLFKNIKEILSTPEGGDESYTQSLFKWSYTAPTQKEVCTDGVQLTVVDHDLEQVSHYLINDGIDLEQVMKLAKPLTSTDYKATYKDIEYLISMDKNQQLQKIVYVDSLDNKVKIIFQNMNYNNSVNEQELECNAPAEYDIIEG